ncbi:hypothetical protein DDK00_00305 [Mycobacteroides abscessus]|uniref:Uncharacterized protein n=1 Tax=Mycobacteroides abscessus (strain ATCC 19977 / DSM 44196 / CCUG 20993 / CIP 104536 / JCM 13569 / NCTC 13031 / TMC 1543 / L948) TaxID=561007 RepID=B1MND6_MYCA9|nr:hypothetical protein DDJ48_10375 [Mycobacteroides abscessus]QPO17573.1 hypothetical protein PHIGD23-1_74 [Mycobacterium phage phiGD23-1]QPO17696.1 hypothetical protein PHIGD22-1_74 [Mycobacterium phage phiGD22-1]QPO17881.1 hypothetical protein PROPHIGD20-1_72 [Mycobacterium phage phiGD20-1]QSM02184.1 hypothetical protein PROPHIGD20-1_40 [Mycobacterium phage prophiGD20-1]QSM02526.1 hypothetical protein PROPHIGD17-2_37 [Mycobacterium phage prophiGD17-2]QSM02643.1 hypothetical protein PROPHIG
MSDHVGRGGGGRNKWWKIRKLGTGWEIWQFETGTSRILMICQGIYPSGAEAIAAFAAGGR